MKAAASSRVRLALAGYGLAALGALAWLLWPIRVPPPKPFQPPAANGSNVSETFEEDFGEALSVRLLPPEPEPEPSPPPAPPPPPPSAPRLTLIGTIIEGVDAQAIVRHDNRLSRVRVGDRIADAMVVAVRDGEIEIDLEGRRHSYSMEERDNDTPRSPANRGRRR